MKKNNISKYIVIAFFAIYLVVGILIYKDYGISSDEPTERTTTLVNVKYVLETFGLDKADGIAVPELEEYSDKYYGTILQIPTFVLETMNLSLRAIYHGRHLYTFLICFIGYIFFFFLCKKMFKSDILGLLGAMMVALYPRFFAEQFYNIKDMIFAAVFMVSMYFFFRVIESDFKLKWLLIFSIVSAVSTNVRIVGIIFLILIIGYIVIDMIFGKLSDKYCARCKHPFYSGIIISLTYFASFIVMLPFTWKNPLVRVAEVFIKFSKFDNWNSTIVFMGQILSKDNLPWYYIPVWLLISVPVWYIFLFILASIFGIITLVGIVKDKKLETILIVFSKYKYVLWSSLLVLIPWLGIVLFHSTVYNAWRHCYFMLPPIVLLILFGVQYIVTKWQKLYKPVALVIIAGMSLQLFWICNNHPYQMVYFNNIGKYFAADFDRDYWHMATLSSVRYIESIDDSDIITIDTSGNDYYLLMLNDGEQERIQPSDDPMYYIESYRGKVGNDYTISGYKEIYSISVDGFKVSTVYKKDKN